MFKTSTSSAIVSKCETNEASPKFVTHTVKTKRFARLVAAIRWHIKRKKGLQAGTKNLDRGMASVEILKKWAASWQTLVSDANGASSTVCTKNHRFNRCADDLKVKFLACLTIAD